MRLISLVLLFSVFNVGLIAATCDSIGVKTESGTTFILHKVEAKETLYGLKTKYGSSIQEIKKANPELSEGLKIGMIIKVPVSKSVTKEDKPNGIAGSKVSQHKVGKGETLYSISRKYNISVGELKKLNNLPSNEISIGQILQLTKAKYTQSIINNTIKEEPKEIVKSNPETDNTKESVSNSEVATQKIKTPSGFEKNVEYGLAALIDGNDESKKYLGLHRTAPYGTIVKVKNEITGFHIFVRIVGKLPDIPTNKKIVIKVSKAAWAKLGGLETEFRAQVEYTP